MKEVEQIACQRFQIRMSESGCNLTLNILLDALQDAIWHSEMESP